MNILFECPHCAQQFERDESLTGITALCPSCKREINIPARAEQSQREIKEAKIINAPAGDPPAAPMPSDKEGTALETRPLARAFLGELILGVVLSPVIVGLIILIDVWIKVVSRKYKITNQRLFVTTGLIARKTEELELFRVKDVKVSQGMLARILRYGTITVYSNDETCPQLDLIGIGDPIKVKETIRGLYRAARLAMGVRATELMMDQ